MLWLVVIIAGMIGLDAWRQWLGRRILADWAARQGYEIRSTQRSVMDIWDYKYSVVFRVTVRDLNGWIRVGQVRCWPNSFRGDRVDVIWESSTPVQVGD